MMESGYKVTTTPHEDGKIVQLVERVELGSITEQIMRRVMDTQESQTRDALIALGWTPPNDQHNRPASAGPG